MTRWPLVLLLLVLLAGCSCSSECDGALCGACPEPVSIRVRLASATDGPVTITGADIGCTASDPGTWICTSGSVGVGDHTITVSAPGYLSRELSFTIGAAPPGCCTCPGSYEDDVTLERAMPGDGGPSDDASVDAGAGDAGAGDASADAATCNPAAVRFPMGGTLTEGTLCDDVFVCVADPADAAAVTAASSRFVCSPTPEGGCAGATCRYADPGGPSTLDAAEIAEICAVTVLAPTPDLVCMVYL